MSNKEEEWRDIKNYEGLYKINKKGEVKSLERKIMITKTRTKTIKEKIRKNVKNQSGLYYIILHKDGKHEFKYIHLLIMETFSNQSSNQKFF